MLVGFSILIDAAVIPKNIKNSDKIIRP